MQKKNVLIVTGITGFIGTNIANSVYFNQNFEIYGLSSKKLFKMILSENQWFKDMTLSQKARIILYAHVLILRQNFKLLILS